MLKKSAHHTHTLALKAKVALAVLHANKTMAELCSQLELHANQVTQWKRQLMERAADVLGAAANQKETAELLGISHDTAHYLTRPDSDADQGCIIPEQVCLNLPPKWPRLHKIETVMRRELPVASVGSLQATTAAVDNSAPLVCCQVSTFQSG